MFPQNAHNNNELTNSPRRRVLAYWSIYSYPANDKTITIHALRGRVVREVDGFSPSLRVTKTSPIVSCDGRVVTTASGSKYTLGTPNTPGNWDNDAPNIIPPEYLNTWIDGDNWLTA